MCSPAAAFRPERCSAAPQRCETPAEPEHRFPSPLGEGTEGEWGEPRARQRTQRPNKEASLCSWGFMPHERPLGAAP